MGKAKKQEEKKEECYKKVTVKNGDDIIGIFYFDTEAEAQTFVEDVGSFMNGHDAEINEKYKGNRNVLLFLNEFAYIREHSKE